MPKNRRKFLIFVGAIVIIQAAWYVYGIHDLHKDATRTTGTVVEVQTISSSCHGRLCDHSAERYPVYEYYDTKGSRHLFGDKFFSAYKSGNPLKLIFGKEIGDTSTIYYKNANPNKAIVMGSLWLYISMLIPTIIGVVALGLYSLMRSRKKSKDLWPNNKQ